MSGLGSINEQAFAPKNDADKEDSAKKKHVSAAVVEKVT